jgi:putative radical SAM enzyme (TIGR03279 family)
VSNMADLVSNIGRNSCRCKERQSHIGALVKDVATGSIADDLGLRPGDRIERINGYAVRDILEYSFLTSDCRVEIEVERGTGERLIYDIEKDEDEDLGILFTSSLFDGTMECTNNCRFCFVRQNPPGVRESLRVRDDDPRLSFLHGNYVSLTNLSDEHFDMLLKMRLSPLYVSVHSTDPRIRRLLMGYDRDIDILGQLSALTGAGITVHCQIVLCPGVNDRLELLRTMTDLARLRPGISSVAVVPVGLTQHRDRLPRLSRPSAEEALVTLEIVQRMQVQCLETMGTRFAFASDEFYFLADREVPSGDEYEEYQQIENGVGLTRSMADEFLEILRERGLSEPQGVRDISIITGVLGARALETVLAPLPGQARRRIHIVPVRNSYFGEPVTVTGLLSGNDIIAGLETLRQARSAHGTGPVLAAIPDVVVNRDGVFVDDISLERVKGRASELGIDLEVVRTTAEGLYAALTGLAE